MTEGTAWKFRSTPGLMNAKSQAVSSSRHTVMWLRNAVGTFHHLSELTERLCAGDYIRTRENKVKRHASDLKCS